MKFDILDETSDNHGADFINSNINVICSSTGKENSAVKTNVGRDDDSDYLDSDDSFDENCTSQGIDKDFYYHLNVYRNLAVLLIVYTLFTFFVHVSLMQE